MSWGLRVRDPGGSGRILFDSTADEVMFYHDELMYDVAVTATHTKQYPSLAGHKIYISAYISNFSPGSFYGNYFAAPQVVVSYPGGTPTITVTCERWAQYQMPLNSACIRIIVMTDGSYEPPGPPGDLWRSRFRNEKGRFTISERSDSYVYLMGLTLAGSGSTGSDQVQFTCEGTPILFTSLSGSGYVTRRVEHLGGNQWLAVFQGIEGSGNAVRVFGRASLNFPNGSTEQWGFRQKNPDTGMVVFDSGLAMLALKGYTSQQLANVRYQDAFVNLGVDLSDVSLSEYSYNIFTREYWRDEGGGYDWTTWWIEFSTYAWVFSSPGYGATLTWSRKRLSWQGYYEDGPPDEGTEFYFDFMTPTVMGSTVTIAVIDNSRYPITD